MLRAKLLEKKRMSTITKVQQIKLFTLLIGNVYYGEPTKDFVCILSDIFLSIPLKLPAVTTSVIRFFRAA